MTSCVIPARMNSTRFPNKPMAKIRGREMILRVMDQAHKANCFERVICATDSLEILSCVENSGYEAFFTEGDFATGSDRVSYVANKLGLDLIVNLQGDEPIVDPQLLQKIEKKINEFPECWVTAASLLDASKNKIKSEVKIRVEGQEAKEFQRKIYRNDGTWFAHRGIYGYSRKNLDFFCKSPQTNEEKSLSLEQLRIFKTMTFKVVMDNSISVSVDTPEDLILAEKLLQQCGIDKEN